MKHSEKYRATRHRSDRRRYDEFRRITDAAKSVPCRDCGKTYPPYVMDFDHVRGEKLVMVSKMMLRNRVMIEAEIAKCDVVCANCHRERTHKRLLPEVLRENTTLVM